MNAKGLFKKLKSGLPIDSKWDLVLIIEKQEKRIAELEKRNAKLEHVLRNVINNGSKHTDESWIDKEKLQQALDADAQRRNEAMDELVAWQQEFEKSAQIIGNKPTNYAKIKEDFE